MHQSAEDRLWVGPLPATARGLVLMLHGGAEVAPEEIDHRSRAYLRTMWMRRSIAGRLARDGVGVAQLRFSVKGWNAGLAEVPPPVADARVALARLRRDHPELPLVLLGHSMGARTAAWVADDPAVVGVVGLAPWFPPDDPVEQLAGRHLVAAHGRRDRITNARATAAYVRRAGEVAASARFVDMGPLGHYLITGVRRWNATAVTECLGVLDRGIADRVAGITSPK
jgi:predicted alpha/beta-hydrolase family hydrolase